MKSVKKLQKKDARIHKAKHKLFEKEEKLSEKEEKVHEAAEKAEHKKKQAKKVHKAKDPVHKKKHSARKSKVAKVMREYKHGQLHSGSKKGPEVKSRKQAIAIALSEARKAGEPVKKKGSKKKK